MTCYEGDIADMMLEGTLCIACGCYAPVMYGIEGTALPCFCKDCLLDEEVQQTYHPYAAEVLRQSGLSEEEQMIEVIETVWDERNRDEGWSVCLTEQGQILVHLREGNSWAVRPLNLHLTLPVGVFDALIKHKGETRRHLALLAEEKK